MVLYSRTTLNSVESSTSPSSPGGVETRIGDGTTIANGVADLRCSNDIWTPDSCPPVDLPRRLRAPVFLFLLRLKIS